MRNRRSLTTGCLVALLAVMTLGAQCNRKADLGEDKKDTGASGTDAMIGPDGSSSDSGEESTPDTREDDPEPDTMAGGDDTSIADAGTDAGGSDTDAKTVQCPSKTESDDSQSCEWTWVEFLNDHDSDTDWDAKRTRAFDSKDRLVREDIDNPKDGTIDRVQKIEYDRCGRKKRKKYDTNNDGTFERVRTWHYDGGSLPVAEELQTDQDPTPEVRKTYEYDSDGNRTVRRIDGLDQKDKDIDGQNDKIYTWSYNDAGKKVRWTYDEDGDGQIDTEALVKYDDSGRRSRTLMDENPLDDSGPVVATKYTYPSNKKIVWKDHDRDGSFDSKDVKVIDSQDRPDKETDWYRRVAQDDWTKDLKMDWSYPTWSSSKRVSELKIWGLQPAKDGEFDGKVDSQARRVSRCK